MHKHMFLHFSTFTYFFNIARIELRNESARHRPTGRGAHSRFGSATLQSWSLICLPMASSDRPCLAFLLARVAVFNRDPSELHRGILAEAGLGVGTLVRAAVRGCRSSGDGRLAGRRAGQTYI